MSSVSTSKELANAGELVNSLDKENRLFRHFQETEVEAKFHIFDVRTDPREILAEALRSYPSGLPLVDLVRNGESLAYPSYQIADGVEHSSFEHEGELIIKIKNHEVALDDELPVMVSSETFLTGANAASWLEANEALSLGQLEKRRAKVFLVDLAARAVYSLAVTVCRHHEAFQRQLEIEYFASVDGTTPDSVRALVAQVAATARSFAAQTTLEVSPTTETKFEFLTKSLKGRAAA